MKTTQPTTPTQPLPPAPSLYIQHAIAMAMAVAYLHVQFESFEWLLEGKGDDTDVEQRRIGSAFNEAEAALWEIAGSLRVSPRLTDAAYRASLTWLRTSEAVSVNYTDIEDLSAIVAMFEKWKGKSR